MNFPIQCFQALPLSGKGSVLAARKGLPDLL
jgi:hypothetical protein